jgi:uncharacterized protein
VKFAAIIEYVQDATKVQAVRPTHRQYLTTLKDKGQLVLAGPFTDGSGSLIVYEAATVEEAEALLQSDPFFAHGIFTRYQLRPWNPVMGNRELLPT